MSHAPAWARSLHRVIEPFHSLMYFAPEVQDRWEAAGLEPRGQGYVVGRSAPMGAVGPGVAAATFFGFNPAVLAYALPQSWDTLSPQAALEQRASGIQAAFERVGAPTDGLAEATELAVAARQGLSFAGRPLGGANAEVDLPDQPFAALWQATAVLREHRGDGHIAALVSGQLGPVEALVLFATWQDQVSRRFLQRSRMWSDEDWEAACDAHRDRGWMDDDGALTDTGQAARDEIEELTDRLAAAPYATLGEDRSRRLFDLLKPIVEAINAADAFPRPVVVPDRF